MGAEFEKICDSIESNPDLENINKVWIYVLNNRDQFTVNQFSFLRERIFESGAVMYKGRFIAIDQWIDEIIIKVADSRWDLDKLQEISDYCLVIIERIPNEKALYITNMMQAAVDEIVERDKKELIKKEQEMQYSNKDYNATIHVRKKALSVKNPYAEYIARGEKLIEVRSKPTKHRGELIICSSQKPVIQLMQSGCILASVDLYDVKPFKDLTEQERLSTKIPREQWKDLEDHYGWMLKNPIRMIEYPVKGQLGIFNLVMDKEEFIPYNTKHTIKELQKPKKKDFDSKAVAIGCSLLIFIFVLLCLAVWGILKAFGVL